MPKIAKKDKKTKLNEIQKIGEYIKAYDTIVVVENTDIQNSCLQCLRTSVTGKVVFTKKSLLQRHYPSLNYDKSFFLIFTKAEEVEKIRSYNYVGFLEVNDVVSEDIIFPKGLIKNTKLHSLLSPLDVKGANTYLTEDFTIIKAGEAVDEKSEKILRIKGDRLVERPVNIIDIVETKTLQITEE